MQKAAVSTPVEVNVDVQEAPVIDVPFNELLSDLGYSRVTIYQEPTMAQNRVNVCI